MLRRKKRGAPIFGDIAAEDDRDIEVHRLGAHRRKHFWGEAGLLLRDLAVALMLALIIGVFIVQPVKVEGCSMFPRLDNGQRIFVNKLIYYELPKLERGDVVVFWFPDDPSKSYIKRIIGLPGETVEVRAGRILINGQELDEPYLNPRLNLARENLPRVVVRNNYYFVMGDNRDYSSDSRRWGLVPKKYIYGKALFRFWPLSEVSLISHDAGGGPSSSAAATSPCVRPEELNTETEDQNADPEQ